MARTKASKRSASPPEAEAQHGVQSDEAVKQVEETSHADKKTKTEGEEEAPDTGPEASRPHSQAPPEGEEEGGAKKEGVVEDGIVSFYYRPKVGLEEASSLDEVQRFFMLLMPSHPANVKPRLAVIGKKRLPDAAKHERFFGFIMASADSVDELTRDLGPKEYETKTRGTRHVAPARVVAEGVYTILEHKGGTRLVFKLEAPSEPGEAQAAFDIPKLGSYVISVKNPDNLGGPGTQQGLREKADYGKEKKKEFKGYAWIPVHDSQLLDYERCEFLLVGAAEDPTAELGATKASVLETVEREHFGPHPDEEGLLQQLKQEIKVEDVGVETKPLETGEWE